MSRGSSHVMVLPLSMPYVRDPQDKEEEKDTRLKSIAARLLQLSKSFSLTGKDNITRSNVLDSSQTSAPKALQSGLEEDDVYVESRPADNFAEVKRKSEKMILGGKKNKELLQNLACGDAKNEIRPTLGKKSLKKARKAEREKSKGPGWFGMAAPEMTEETKRDLEVLQMRSALDPKRFYKKNDLSVLPKYFQIGQVIDSHADYYADRIPNKERKKTLVDELLADAEFRKYNKRKYTEIIEEKSKQQKRYQGKKKKQSS